MAAILRARGTVCGQFAQWTLAARDLTQAVALDPDEHWNWYQLAPLLLETGDVAGYRKHCHAALARFAKTDTPCIAERTAKMCLLLPLDGPDLAEASNLAERAVKAGNDDALAAYYQFVKALAEYREGSFQSAAEWAARVQEQAGGDYRRDVQAYSVLAMAQHRLHREGEAHTTLRKAIGVAETNLPKLDSGDLGPDWHDWIIAQTLLREAKGLVETK